MRNKKCQLVLRIISVGVVVLPACSVLNTSHLAGDDEPIKGVSYCLPYGKIRLIVTSAQLKAPGKAPLLPTTPQAATAAPGGGTEFAEVELPPPSDETVAAATPTPPPSPEVKSAVPKMEPSYGIKYVDTYYYPDKQQRYALRYQPSVLAEDDVVVTLGKDGLLDKVDVTTEDKSDEIALKIVEIGSNLARIAAASSAAAQPETIYDATFDPFDPIAAAQVRKDLARLEGGPFNFKLLNRSPEDYKATIAVESKSSRSFTGIAFRPVLAYDLVLQKAGITQTIQTVLLPNEAEVLRMPITRSAFVKKVVSLDFSGGILIQAKINKPSEALAGIEIPLAITKAILALPGQIIADNTAIITARTSLAQKKTELIKAKNAHETTLEEEAKRKKLSETPTGPARPGDPTTEE